jgi:hypothetical protein
MHKGIRGYRPVLLKLYPCRWDLGKSEEIISLTGVEIVVPLVAIYLSFAIPNQVNGVY